MATSRTRRRNPPRPRWRPTDDVALHGGRRPGCRPVHRARRRQPTHTTRRRRRRRLAATQTGNGSSIPLRARPSEPLAVFDQWRPLGSATRTICSHLQRKVSILQMPGGPVGPPATWAATSNVEGGSGTDMRAPGLQLERECSTRINYLQGPPSS